MTMLKTPPGRAEAYASGQYHWSWCGESVVASVIQEITGQFIIEQTLAIEMGKNCACATTASDLVAELRRHGIASHTYYNVPILQAIAAGNSRNHYVIPLINSDSGGVPTSVAHTGHWINVYGTDGAGYHAMNPAYGTLNTYPASQLQGADFYHQGLEVDWDASVPVPAPTPPPPAPPAPAPTNPVYWVSFSGVVDANQVAVRRQPGATSPLIERVNTGTHFSFNAWTRGPVAYPDAITGKPDNRWFHIPSLNGWIASAYVNGNPPNSTPT